MTRKSVKFSDEQLGSGASPSALQVLALTGSPRRHGNTETLVAAVMAGVAESGVATETVRLADLKIAPCIGCGGCQQTGRCVILDDMQGLYDKVARAQAIVLASPIYFYALSAQTKIFVDRLQALWSKKQLLMAARQWPSPLPKKGYLVAVAATQGTKVFVGAQLTAQYAFDAMGASYAGELLVRGLDGRHDLQQMPAKLLEAEQFGRDIALALGGTVGRKSLLTLPEYPPEND